MKYQEILKTFEQDQKGKEYEDKLSKYFELHYELLHNWNGELDYHIGEVYYDKDGDRYCVITHQISNYMVSKSLVYDLGGNLIFPTFTEVFYNGIPEKYVYFCTYKDLMQNINIRKKIGLEYELKRAKNSVKIYEKELEKINRCDDVSILYKNKEDK